MSSPQFKPRTPFPDPGRIREARQQSGLTQTQAGALVYTSCRTWQKWEAGNFRMHPSTFDLFLLKTGQADLVADGDEGVYKVITPPDTLR